MSEWKPIGCSCPSPVERVKCQHEVAGVMPNLLKFIQALLQACQQIFLHEKKRKKTAKRGLASKEELLPVRT